jgi:hypothetical protein
MAPEVGLEPTTLRLRAAFPTLHKIASKSTGVANKRVMVAKVARTCMEEQKIPT